MENFKPSDFFETFQGKFLPLLESAKGDEWEVVLIEAGRSKGGSQGQILYPEEVLKRAVPLFENCKCYAFEFSGQVYDHLPENIKQAVPQGFAKNLVGYFTSPKLKKLPNGKKGIVAKFHVIADWLKSAIKNAGKKLPELLGFSIDAEGIVDRSQGMALSIDRVDSVDLVTYPAAGGRFLRMVASRLAASIGKQEEGQKKGELNTKGGNSMNPMLLAIKGWESGLQEGQTIEATDDVVSAIFGNVLDEEVIKESRDELKEIITQCVGFLSEGKEELAEALITGIVEAKKKKKKKEEYPTPAEKYPAPQKASQEEPNGDMEEAKKKKKKDEYPVYPEIQKQSQDLEALKNEITRLKLEKYLEEALKESGLTSVSKEQVRNMQFSSTEDIDKAIGSMKDLEAKFMQEAGVSSRVEAGNTEGEKTLQMIEDVLEGKSHSIKEAYIRFTGDKKVTGLIKECAGRGKARITESLTTSDWAEALGDTLRRKLIKEYKVSGLDDWKKIVSDIVPLPDFRDQHWIRLGGYGELPSVSQGATYTELTSPTDEEVTLSVSKKGGLESVTLEMIKNDDILAVRQIPKRLARAAAQALYNAIFDDILKDNATVYDNVALFHSNHNNLGSTALSPTSYMATRKAMGQQTAYGNSEEYLNLYPKYLIVPLDLEHEAFKLCHSPVYVNQAAYYDGGGASEAATTPNIIPQKFKTDYIVVPRWTDANDWIAVADPNMCPTIVVGFLDGNEDPEIFIQDQPSVGSLFYADKIVYKIRHIWGVAVFDYRPFYKHVVS
ncbi:hypothetical protein J7K19_05715 [bacterium]|nr:hypothetical protein [bacterium]